MIAIKIIFLICALCYLFIRFFHSDQKEKHITIYKDNNPDAARSIWLTLNGGVLNMTEQDIGPLVEYAFGNSCHERYLSNISAKALKKAVGTHSDIELKEKLKDMFGTNSGFDNFTEFLRNKGINYEYGSY